MRPDLIPTSHSRHVGRRIIAGNGDLPPLRVEDMFFAEAERAANENERDGLVAAFLMLGLMIATCVLAGVLGFMIGRMA